LLKDERQKKKRVAEVIIEQPLALAPGDEKSPSPPKKKNRQRKENTKERRRKPGGPMHGKRGERLFKAKNDFKGALKEIGRRWTGKKAAAGKESTTTQNVQNAGSPGSSHEKKKLVLTRPKNDQTPKTRSGKKRE